MMTPEEYFGTAARKRVGLTPEEYFSGRSLSTSYSPTKATAMGAAKAVVGGTAREAFEGAKSVLGDVKAGLPTWYQVPGEVGETLALGAVGFVDKYLGQVQSTFEQFAKTGKVDWNVVHSVGQLREQLYHSDPKNPISRMALNFLGSVPEGIRQFFHKTADLVAQPDPDHPQTVLADGLRAAGDLASEAAFMKVFKTIGETVKKPAVELGEPKGPTVGRDYKVDVTEGPRRPMRELEKKAGAMERRRLKTEGMQEVADWEQTSELLKQQYAEVLSALQAKDGARAVEAQKATDELVRQYLESEEGRAVKPGWEKVEVPVPPREAKARPRWEKPPTPEEYFGKQDVSEPLEATRIKRMAEEKALQRDTEIRRKLEAESFKRRKKNALAYLNWAREQNGLPTISGQYLEQLGGKEFSRRPPADYGFQSEIVDAIRRVYGKKEADSVQKVIDMEQAALGETGKPPVEQTIPYRREAAAKAGKVAEGEDFQTKALLDAMKQKWRERQGEQYGEALSSAERLLLLKRRGKALEQLGEKRLDPKMEAEKRAYQELTEYEEELSGHPEKKSLLESLADMLLDESGSAQIVDDAFLKIMEQWKKKAEEKGETLKEFIMRSQRLSSDLADRMVEQYEKNRMLPVEQKTREYLSKPTTRRDFLEKAWKGAKTVASSGLVPSPVKLAGDVLLGKVAGKISLKSPPINSLDFAEGWNYGGGLVETFKPEISIFAKKFGVKLEGNSLVGNLSPTNLTNLSKFATKIREFDYDLREDPRYIERTQRAYDLLKTPPDKPSEKQKLYSKVDELEDKIVYDLANTWVKENKVSKDVADFYVENKLARRGGLEEDEGLWSVEEVSKELADKIRKGKILGAARRGKAIGEVTKEAHKFVKEQEPQVEIMSEKTVDEVAAELKIRHDDYNEGFGHGWTDTADGPTRGYSFSTDTAEPGVVKEALEAMRQNFTDKMKLKTLEELGNIKAEGVQDGDFIWTDNQTGAIFSTKTLDVAEVGRAKAEAISRLVAERKAGRSKVVKELEDGTREELINAHENGFGWVELKGVKPEDLKQISEDTDLGFRVRDGKVQMKADPWSWARARANKFRDLPEQERLKQVFGTTKNPEDAGWILPDGSMLEFRKEKYGWLDHDTIDEVVDNLVYASVESPYIRVARISPEELAFEFNPTQLTQAQLRKLNSIVRDHPAANVSIDLKYPNATYSGITEYKPGRTIEGYMKIVRRTGKEVTTDFLGLQTAWEMATDFTRKVRAGKSKEVQAIVEKVRKEVLRAAPGNALDQMATQFLLSKDFKDYLEKMPYLGKLTPQEVWKLSEKIRGAIAPLEKTQGAIKKVRGAIRKSGFYAVREFAEQVKGYRDISPRTGLLDPTRAMQQIDQGRFGGPTQKHILWPTRRNMLAKLMWIDQRKMSLLTLKEKYNVNSKKKAKALGELLELEPGNSKSIDNVYRKWKIKPGDRKSLGAAAEQMRKLFDSLIKEQNAARGKRNQKQIPYRAFYRPWVVEANLWNRLGFGDRKPADIAEKPVAPDFIFPDRPFVPHTEARSALLKNYPKELDAIRLMSDYIESAGKDIFDTNTVQSNKIYSAVLKNQGLEHAAKFVDDWTGEVFAGTQPLITKWARQSVHPTIRQAAFFIRRNLGRSVFPLNWAWNAFIQTSSGGLTIARYGLRNSVKGLDAFTNLSLKKQIEENAYSHIIKTRRGASPSMQDLGDNLMKLKKLDGKRIDNAIDWMNYLTRKVEEVLTRHAVAAAYHHGQKMGLKGRELWEYASEGGAKTQSMYNYQDLPGLLRAKELTAVAPFQTFAMEVFNTVREINVPGLNKIVGKAGLTDTLLSQRLKMIAEWTAVMLVTNAVVDRAIGRKPWELSSFIPFYALLSGGYASKGPVHHSYIQGFKNGVKGVIQHGNWKLLRRWFITYHVPAGVQLNRTIEGIEAAISGKVTNVAGRTQYKVTGPQEKRRAVALGPSRTRAGVKLMREKRGSFFMPSKTKKKTGLPGLPGLEEL